MKDMPFLLLDIYSTDREYLTQLEISHNTYNYIFRHVLENKNKDFFQFIKKSEYFTHFYFKKNEKFEDFCQNIPVNQVSLYVDNSIEIIFYDFLIRYVENFIVIAAKNYALISLSSTYRAYRFDIT